MEYKLLFWLTGVQEPVWGGDRVADPNSGSHGSIHPRVPEHSLGADGPRAASRHPAGTPPNHVHLRTQPGGRHAAAPGSVLRQDMTVDGAGVGGVRVLMFCLCVFPQVRIICWRWMSWSVRCMTPTNLISCSMEIWRKLTFSSRSVLYLWLDTHAQIYQNCYFILIHFLFSIPLCLSVFFSFFLCLGTRGGDWLRGRVEPLCWQIVRPGQRCCGPLCQTDWWPGRVWPPQSPQSPFHQVKDLFIITVISRV